MQPQSESSNRAALGTVGIFAVISGVLTWVILTALGVAVTIPILLGSWAFMFIVVAAIFSAFFFGF